MIGAVDRLKKIGVVHDITLDIDVNHILYAQW